MKKKINKQKVLELLKEFDDTITIEENILKDGRNTGILRLNNICLIDYIENGVIKSGSHNLYSALVAEYLHKYKDEVIVKKYTNEEVAEVLKNEGFRVNADSIYTKEEYEWITQLSCVVSCLNSEKETRNAENFNREELALATIVKNKLEEGEVNEEKN